MTKKIGDPLDELTGATVRLLECLAHPLDGRILGPQIVREIIYRVLRGEQGVALRLLAARHSRFGQIAKVLKRMHTEFDAGLDIETLANLEMKVADLKGMSMSGYIVPAGSLFKVRAGPWADRPAADQAQAKLKSRFGGSPFVVKEP